MAKVKARAADPRLGLGVEDVITGFRGRIVGICDYISGCQQALIQPRVKPSGEFTDSMWIDIDRLDVVEENPIVLSMGDVQSQRSVVGSDKPAPKR